MGVAEGFIKPSDIRRINLDLISVHVDAVAAKKITVAAEHQVTCKLFLNNFEKNS